MTTRRLFKDQHGQAIAILGIAMVALLAMTALVVDGGNAFAQQRITQNAADAASEAGATVLMQELAGAIDGSGLPKDGDDVNAAVQANAAANGLTTPVQGCYTDVSGRPLNSDGTTNSDCLAAAQVGPGLPIPPCAACPSGSASGVRVSGSRPFDTFFAGIIGLHDLTAAATATAISGYVTGLARPVIPVTYPVFATACDDNTSEAIPGSTTPWPVGPNNVLTIPLCKDSQGNVGWLDWTPPAGGSSELADAILGNPPNPTITTPRWYSITSTGNPNSSQVQTNMEHWIGTSIIIPIFSETCGSTPTGLADPIHEISDCSSIGGHGQNNWYYLVGFAAFQLIDVHIQGNNASECNAYPVFLSGGNGGTSCLVGYFVGPQEAVSLGASVGAGGGSDTSTSIVGVQLIR